jgi:hypothetical protein
MLLDAFKLGDFPVDEFTRVRLSLENIILTDAIVHACKEDFKNLQNNTLNAK